MSITERSSTERTIRKLRIVVPPLFPFALAGVLGIAEWSGNALSVHGAGLVVGELAFVSALLLVPYELALLEGARRTFSAVPASNTLLNWASFAFGASFVAAVVGLVVYTFVFGRST
jgi:hypothetical protein